MQSWLGKKLVDHQLAALRAGNIKPTMRMDSREVELTFPGDNSWSGVYRGRDEVARASLIDRARIQADRALAR